MSASQKKFTYLTERERGAIKVLAEKGVPVKYLAEAFQVHSTTIQRVLSGKTSYRRKRGRFESKTTKREDSLILMTLKRNYYKSVSEIQREYFPQYSRWLLQNRMQKHGLSLQSPIIKPSLNAQQKKARYEFALKMQNRPVSFWRSVFFSDETMVRDQPWSYKQKFISGPSFPKSSLPVIRTEAFPAKILGWFAIKYGEGVRWRAIDGSLNSESFVAVLRDVFSKELKRNYTGHVILIQDNAPCHTARKVSHTLGLFHAMTNFSLLRPKCSYPRTN